MNTIRKILLPIVLLVACDREDTDNAEPNAAVVEANDDDRADRGHRGHGKLKKLDIDGDGLISQAEARDSRIADRFAELDADRDGKLSKDELHAMRGHGKGRGEGHGKGGKWHDMDPAERAAKMMEKFDADRDGSLSAAELAGHPKLAGKFAEVDTNRDGKLSAAELGAFKASHGKHGRGPGGEKNRG